MTLADAPLIAAIRCPDGVSADAVLARAAARFRAEGVRLAGHVQGTRPGRGGAVTVVEDLVTGEVRPITQDLGPGSAGCTLDPAALAEVAAALLARLDGPLDLLVVNRFGKGEAEGRGLRAAIERAVMDGVPVLTVLRADHAEAWDQFTGGEAVLLEPDDEAILNWARAAILSARAAD
jgi:nucleoside-triphosphatase THEP1